MKYSLIYLFVLCFIFVAAKGQELPSPARVVTLTPQYWLARGLRLDYDKQLARANQFINLATVFYMDDDQNDFDLFDWENPYKRMAGGGIKAFHKIFLPRENKNASGTYLAYGGSVELFGFDVQKAVWEEYTEDGLEYQEYRLFMARQYTIKAGADVLIGWQAYQSKSFLLDFYVGAGARYAEGFIDKGRPLHLRRHFMDFGYRGTLLLMGLEIGGILPY